MKTFMKLSIHNLVFCFFVLAAYFVINPSYLLAGENNGDNTKIKMVEEENRLSLSIQDANIRSVLKALSMKKKLNMVIAQDVSGKISVNLHNLPLKDILNAVINLNGFSYVQKDDIIFVSGDKKSSAEDFPESKVMTFKLKYADINEIEKIIANLVSESAKISIYKPEKIVIVEDMPRYLDQVKTVLATLDIPPKQVLIETKIMEIRLNDDTSLGIDWNAVYSGFLNSSGDILNKGFTGANKGLFFNLVNGEFELFLEALRTRSNVKTLSSPRLLALDNKEAKIIIGGKLGYHVTTATEGTVLQSVEFLETGTQLILTPHIIDDGRVIMDIHPEISDGTIINGLPTETTTEVTTSLMAPDNGTIFIGGLIRNRKEDIKSSIPGLGAIPILGALFSKTTNITVRTEIIVLITPHIITADNLDMLEQDTQKVMEAEEHVKKERAVKELIE